jgi:putative iron-dependent peroxidase
MTAPAHAALAAPPPAALALWLRAAASPLACATALAGLRLPPGAVLGLGRGLIDRIAGPDAIPMLPAMVDRGGGAAPACPADQADLWVLVGGDDPGAALHAARAALKALQPAFALHRERSLYLHRGGRDLSGYADGTENPTGQDAVEAAIVGDGPLAGSTFAAVQSWQHQLDALAAHPPAARDQLIGRTEADDTELDDAPPSAHVKRTAQEDFDPPTFLVRRSMPWGGVEAHGLLFLAYSVDPAGFDRMLGRMLGEEDGVVDSLFRFSRVLDGGHYWCPAVDPTGALRLEAARPPRQG